jgi:proteasome accessory factor B
MPDDPPLIRQWNLLRTLAVRRYGVTVREMAQESGVAEKTIRRDLELFDTLGVPLEDIIGDHGRKAWRLAGNWSQPPLTFTFEEAASLYMGQRFLEPLAGTPFWSAAQSAWRKIRATLGDTALRYLDRFSRLFHCTTAGLGDYAAKAEVLDNLTLAIEEYKAVHITYQSQQATEPATRDVYPLQLVRHKGSLYLLAFSPEHDEVRTYKIDRIESVEVSAIVFQRHRDFDVAAHLAGSVGIYDGSGDITVVVRFLPPAARYVSESHWHASQVLTSQRDGSLLARFQLSNTVEIKSWVLGFGANAVVLEPQELRTEIAAELEQLLKAYGRLPVRARKE